MRAAGRAEPAGRPPPGRGVVIFIDIGPAKLSNTDQRPGADLGYGVDGYSLELADASPQCTGS